MALKYIPYGYGICRLLIYINNDWVGYSFGVLKIDRKPIAIVDKFINNKGNYVTETIGYRIYWDLELVSIINSKLGNQLDIISFLNDYWRRTNYDWFWVYPQHSEGNDWVVNATVFEVISKECPKIVDFKVNKKIGQKLILKVETRDLILPSKMWTIYRDTDGNWGGYEPAGMGIMNETFDNV